MPTRLRRASGSDSDPTRRDRYHVSQVSIQTLLVACTKEGFLNMGLPPPPQPDIHPAQGR